MTTKSDLAATGALLKDVLEAKYVRILNSSTKKDALDKLIKCISESPSITDLDEFAKGIYHREDLMSTGIGMGMAVPHVRLASITQPVMCVGVCRDDILDYESLDNESVKYIFMIAAGKDQHEQHLKLLSSISSLFKDDKLRTMLINAKDEKEIYEVLVNRE